MTRSIALLLGFAAAIATWFVAPIVRPDIGEVWFIGAGDWNTIALHGREIVSAAAGIVGWVSALHLPRRGKVIAGIRVGAPNSGRAHLAQNQGSTDHKLHRLN